LLLLAVAVVVRVRLDDWARRAIEQRLADSLGAQVQIGGLRLEISRLAILVRDFDLSIDRKEEKALRLTIKAGSLRLAWNSLLGFGERKIHIADLMLREACLETDDSWLRPPAEGEARDALPIDLRIDNLELIGGSWRHAGHEKRLDFGVENLDVQGACLER
jgi:hypothetical protein